MAPKRKAGQALSQEFIEDDDEDVKPDAGYGEDDDEKPIKKSKKEVTDAQPAASSSNDAVDELEVNAEGDKYVDLGRNKRVTIRTFKKAVLIDIREYYVDKEGESKPGKKGIALSPDAWRSLKENIAAIDAEVAHLSSK